MKITITYQPEEFEKASTILHFLWHFLPEAKTRTSHTHPPQCTVYMTTKRPEKAEGTLDHLPAIGYNNSKE